MKAALHLAGPDDLPALLQVVSGYRAAGWSEIGEAEFTVAVAPLLEGSPHGAVYLIGPRRAPVGYIALSFGWSLDHGGMTGSVDEFYIREGVRGRGIGSEVLSSLIPALEAAGVRALHLRTGEASARARQLHARHGFRMCESDRVMTRTAPAR